MRFVVFGAIALMSQGSSLTAQVPPTEDWRQFDTEHFVVTFPASLESISGRAAERAERAWAQFSDQFTNVPEGRVQLLLSRHSDVANGFASPFPYNRIVIFVHPPLEGGSLSYFDDWLELVITHELAHTFHVNLTGGLGKVLRGVFGRVPWTWPAFPSHSTPTWMLEGLATYYESQFTESGRVQGTYNEMVLRTAVAEDDFASPSRVLGTSPVWPSGSRPYVYGSGFLQWLSDRYGEAAVAGLAETLAGQLVPFRMSAAIRNVVGTSLGTEWRDWEASIQMASQEQIELLEAWGPLTQGESIESSGRLAQQAIVSPDGRTLAFARSDGVDQTQIRIMAPDGSDSRRLTRLNGVTTLSWTPEGDLVYPQRDFVDLYRFQSDLYRTTLEGDVTRLTQGARVGEPDVSPGGESAVAIRNTDGGTELVLVDLKSGAISSLSGDSLDENWAAPRWSPDGTKIAVVRWRPGSYMDIVLLDAEGRLLRGITEDRALDAAPYWSPDGTWLVWSSDRTGISNLFAVPSAGGTIVQLTNMTGGATSPSVGPSGDWLYFSSYHSNGWHIERIPFEPERASAPQPTDPRFGDGPSIAEGLAMTQRTVEGDSHREYSAWGTLAPRYWLPFVVPGQTSVDNSGLKRTAVDGSLGVVTSGGDLVGRHGYGASAAMSREKRFSGAFAYTYGGLGNPRLSFSVSQNHDPESRTVNLLFPDSTTREYFLVSKERRARVTASVVRRRIRTFSALNLSGGMITERLGLLDFSGDPGPTLSRPRPKTTFLTGRATLVGSTAQFRPFSFGAEDGLSAFVSAGLRRATDLAASARNVVGEDRSYREVLGEISAYKALPGPGFANHVLAVRVSAGAGFGSGAGRGHFDMGGADGAGGFLGGESQLFPVRGYSSDRRIGHRAWSASAEYRFPLLLVDQAPGLLPFFVDRISGAFFFDAGNAWGPATQLSTGETVGLRLDPLLALGGELQAIVTPFYLGALTIRIGVGVPLEGGAGAMSYFSLGRSF